jgi:hypothetical protein
MPQTQNDSPAEVVHQARLSHHRLAPQVEVHRNGEAPILHLNLEVLRGLEKGR